jgi:hypothetical protein
VDRHLRPHPRPAARPGQHTLEAPLSTSAPSSRLIRASRLIGGAGIPVTHRQARNHRGDGAEGVRVTHRGGYEPAGRTLTSLAQRRVARSSIWSIRRSGAQLGEERGAPIWPGPRTGPGTGSVSQRCDSTARIASGWGHAPRTVRANDLPWRGGGTVRVTSVTAHLVRAGRGPPGSACAGVPSIPAWLATCAGWLADSSAAHLERGWHRDGGPGREASTDRPRTEEPYAAGPFLHASR